MVYVHSGSPPHRRPIGRPSASRVRDRRRCSHVFQEPTRRAVGRIRPGAAEMQPSTFDHLADLLPPASGRRGSLALLGLVRRGSHGEGKPMDPRQPLRPRERDHHSRERSGGECLWWRIRKVAMDRRSCGHSNPRSEKGRMSHRATLHTRLQNQNLQRIDYVTLPLRICHI